MGIQNKIDEPDLAKIYNIFDVYIQYANSEGFGMPQLEALGCGVPLMAVDYSAMESVIANVGAIALKPKTFSKECETGCDRAIPDNDQTVNEMLQLYQLGKGGARDLGSQMRARMLKRYSLSLIHI